MYLLLISRQKTFSVINVTGGYILFQKNIWETENQYLSQRQSVTETVVSQLIFIAHSEKLNIVTSRAAASLIHNSQGGCSLSLYKALVPLPTTPPSPFRIFVSPFSFSIPPFLRHLLLSSPDPYFNSPSITLIKHTNLPYTITRKISISSNQLQPFTF